VARQRVSYAGVLRRLRIGRGVSQRALAGAIGVSQPLVARTEAGARRPEGAGEIAAVARALALEEDEYDELLLLAGYWPSAFLRLGPDDPTLRAVASALADEALPLAVREEIRRAIDGVTGAVAAAWTSAAPDAASPAEEAAGAARPHPSRGGVSVPSPRGRRDPAAGS
jgi:transcriptional regulator with XRE-family HTH domain